jgi:hypothetical protein
MYRGCSKNQADHRGHNAPQRILVVSRNGRTRVPVIPIIDNPPKYHDLDTVSLFPIDNEEITKSTIK